METNEWLMLAIFIFGAACLFGFFRTKKAGFGRFTTSALLLILVVTISSMLFAGGKIDSTSMVNVIFAVFGFAGGLFTGKDAA